MGGGRFFRPYRDIRFSKDKSAYKTNIAAIVGDGYVQLSADGLATGCGMYEMATYQLDRFRKAVAADRSGEQLTAVVAEARAAGLEITAYDVLKTAPRGYPKDHPRIELLRHKGLITWRQWPVSAWLGTRRAKDRVVEFLRRSKPITGWLNAHVDPSELPDRR